LRSAKGVDVRAWVDDWYRWPAALVELRDLLGGEVPADGESY